LKRLRAPKWTPHGYQKKVVKFCLQLAAALVLLDPGLGKTSIMLAVLLMLKKEKMAERMFIIAPLRVCYQVWPGEVAAWSDFQHLRVGILHGKDKEKVLANYEDYDILVINPEGLDWLVGKHPFADLRRIFRNAILTVDELTRFKNATGKRFKLLKSILPLFQRRYGLTGTPAPNGLLDLFGQVYVIDEGKALGRFITHYKREYFRPLDPNGWKWAPQPGAEERIYAALAPLAIRMAAKDYLELPEYVEIRHTIELPAAVRKTYDVLEEDLVASFQRGEIVAGNAAAASTKCRQICNGAVYVDDDVAALVGGKKRTVMELHDLKLEAVAEFLEDLQGQPFLMAYEFNHDLERLLKKFPNTPYIGKGISPAEGKRIEDRWNRGEIPFLLAHPASAGHGLNLQKGQAAHVGFFNPPWDYELWKQFIDRVLRQGNKNKRVFNHVFVAHDTVDIIALYDKHRKERGQDKLFTGLLEMQASRKASKR
jgi:SNF2 family DNA or RNA helicase